MRSVKFFLILFLIFILMTACSSSDKKYDSPTDLQVVKVADGKLRLTWKYSSSAKELTYTVAKKDGSSPWVDEYYTSEDDERSYIDEVDLSGYKVYSYKVRANDEEEGTSTAYSTATAVFSDNAKPIDLEVSQTGQKSIVLEWKDMAEGEVGYKIDKKIGDGNWQKDYKLLVADSETFTDSIHTLFQEISYRVYAYVNETDSDKLEIKFTPSFAAPTELSLEQVTQGRIKLSWNDNSNGEDGFEVYRKIGSEGEWSLPNLVEADDEEEDTEIYIDELNIDAGTIFYKVRAYSDSMYSMFTDTQSINFNLNLMSEIEIQGNPTDMVIYENHYAYIATEFDKIQIYDISNQLYPILVGTIQDVPGKIMALKIYQDIMFVTNENGGLWLFLMNDLIAPVYYTNVDMNPLQNQPYDVEVGEINGVEYAFIAGGEAGLIVIELNFTNPAGLTVTSRYNTHGKAYAVKKIGNYIYLADESDGIKKIDVSDPYNIDDTDLVDENPYADGAIALSVYENKLYVGCGIDGTKIYALDDLSTLINSYDTHGQVNDLSVSNHFIYMADADQGLTIVDISDLNEKLYEIANIKTETNAVEIEINLSYAYVATNNKLYIIQIVP